MSIESPPRDSDQVLLQVLMVTKSNFQLVAYLVFAVGEANFRLIRQDVVHLIEFSHSV